MSNVSFAAAMSGPKAPRLRPGTYRSTVTAVEPAEEYCEGKAIKIAYQLTDKSGNTHAYSEVFFVGNRYERTRLFCEYLHDNGIPVDNLDEFVGCTEELVLKKSTRGKFLTIESRQFMV